MDPGLVKSWIDVLTQGTGLIVTAAVVIMLAGAGLSWGAALTLAWRFGLWDWIKRFVVGLEKQNEATEKMIEICNEHDKEIKP